MIATNTGLSPREMAERRNTASKVAAALLADHRDHDFAEGYFLDHVVPGASEEQGDILMGILDLAYGR